MSELLKYKCPNCGGVLEFDSGTQQMKCPYCDSTVDVQALSGYDEELKNAAPDQMNWEKEAGNIWDDEETK
jgi:DNA-directed RNA polymerase subunit RPC12/RpoP